MGHPSTFNSQPLIFIDEGGNEQGYDRDGKICSFFDVGYDEPPLNGDDEEEIGIGQPAQAP